MKVNTEIFIQRAKLIHGEKYNYSKVNYTKSKTKVIIICNKHGEFQQRADGHIGKSKFGCPKCSYENNITPLPILLERFNAIHNNFYDYSLVEYKNTNIKVIIGCPTHGLFEQLPSDHIRGVGCIKCSHERKLNTAKLSEYLEKFKMIHGDYYDYSKFKYVNYSSHKSIIICPIHGEFLSTVDNHMKCGCKYCNKSNLRKLPEYLNTCSIVHNNKYDYSKFIYVLYSTRSTIICPKHGEFNMSISAHIIGCGCPKCRISKGENKIISFLNELDIKFELQKRFKECKNKNYLPFDFYLPDYNLLIEYQGAQHFIKPSIWTSFNLEKQQLTDLIKKNFAENNGFNFLEITYKENIKTKILDTINKIKGGY